MAEETELQLAIQAFESGQRHLKNYIEGLFPHSQQRAFVTSIYSGLAAGLRHIRLMKFEDATKAS